MNDKTEQSLTTEPEPAARQFQGRDGVWRNFIDERHLQYTVEDGSWPLRNLYTQETIDTLRAQLTEAQRELIAKEAERAGMELERNNAQRQHTMQGAINKIDSQRILELTAQLDEAQAAQTINQYPPITTEMIYQHVQANQARHFLRVSWKDGIDIEEPTHSVKYLLHAYADAAREGWSSPKEVQQMRAAIDAAKGEING